jgi:5S rRNA maturation endonuclease (ribonuclease M5)
MSSSYIENAEYIQLNAQILPVVDRFLKLNNKNKACCPFHDESTPSFSVDDKKNIYKCFGCGEGGDAVRFVMKHQKLPYTEAIEIVANICGIEIQRQSDYSTLEKQIKEFKEATLEQEEGQYYYDVKEIEDYELSELFPRFNDQLPESKKEEKRKKLIATLRKLNVHALSYVIYIKNRKQIITKTHPRFPIFLIDHGDFKKLYKPKEREKQYRFLYIGNKKEDYINGYTQLIKAYSEHNNGKREEQYDDEGNPITSIEEKLEEVIICSGERDSFNVAAMGYNVVWLNSESALLTDSQLISLKKYAKKVYNLPDIDATGKREGLRLAMQHLEIHTIHLPTELLERRDFRGNFCKDVTDYLKYYNHYDFKKLFENALPAKFWDERAKYFKGKFTHFEYEFNNVYAYNFLNMNGFCRYREEEDREDYIFVHYENGVVRQVTSNHVKMFIHEFLQKRMMDIKLRNAMYKTNQLNDTSLSNLNFKQLDFTACSKNHQLIVFKNKTIKITDSSIEEIKFSDLDTYVWNDKLIDHKLEVLEPMFKIDALGEDNYSLDIINKESYFFQYIINTSRMHWQKELEDGIKLDAVEIQEQNLHIINKIYCLGYLLHQYKDASKPWAVFAMDNRISDDGESQGGSGKSIAFNIALNKMLRGFYINGKNKKNLENPHVYEGITKNTDFVIVDDCDRYVRFDTFFNIITGDLSVNPKGQKQYTIPFKDSPKLAFTSNFTPDKSDGSTQRRILYTVFSDWYHDNTNEEYKRSFTPRDEFGLQLFEDFDEKQWNLFYNFMLLCIQTYLRFPKINPPMGNVMRRNLMQRMGDNFKHWADVYMAEFLNKEVVKQVAFENFQQSSNMKKMTTQRFTQSLKAWAQYSGYIYNPEHMLNKDGRIIGKHDGKTVEMFFVQSTTEDSPALEFGAEPKLEF